MLDINNALTSSYFHISFRNHANNALVYKEKKLDIENKYNLLNKQFEEKMVRFVGIREF